MKDHFTDTGFVLSRQNLGEHDRIIRIFSLQHGSMSAIARGVRKSTSKLASHMEPFQEVQWRFVGKNNLPVIIGAEIIRLTPPPSDIDQLWPAHAILELTDRSFTESETNQAWYDFLTLGLPLISKGYAKTVWMIGLARSLDQLGLTPELPLDSDDLFFNLATGAFTTQQGTTPISRRSLKLWQLSRTHAVDSIVRIKDIESETQDLANLLEQFWVYHTGFNLKSRQLAV
ncbi:MAG: DNA repair protein RecO [Candidatus Saccharibacteria bacterium]